MYEIRKEGQLYFIYKRYLFFFWRKMPDSGFAYKKFIKGHTVLPIIKRVLQSHYRCNRYSNTKDYEL